MTRPPETGTRNKKSVCPSLCGFALCLSHRGTVLATPRDGLQVQILERVRERKCDGFLQGQCPSSGSEVRVTVH